MKVGFDIFLVIFDEGWVAMGYLCIFGVFIIFDFRLVMDYDTAIPTMISLFSV